MTTHSSILAWKIPWIEGPGRLQSTGLHRCWIRLSNWTTGLDMMGFILWAVLHDTSEEILQKVKSQMGWLWVNQRRDCCEELRLKEGVFKRLLEKKVGVWVILSLVLRTCGCSVVSGPMDGPRWLWPDRKPSLGRNREAFMHPHGNELHHNPWAGKMVWASDKNERKTNAIHWHIHMESRKTVLMNLLAGQHWRYRHRERILWMQRGRRGWEELREYHWNKYITVRKIASGNLLCDTGSSLNPVLCDSPEGWDGMGGCGGVQGGGTYGWFMLMCSRNQHNILKQLSCN